MAIDYGERNVVRFFTGARRIPLLIGKFPQGGRIPGGPYRLSQLFVGSIVLVAGWNLRFVWGPLVGSPLVQIIALLVAAAGATFAAGRLPATRRRLPDLAMGAVTATTVSSVGSYKGRPVRLPTPHRVTGQVALQLTIAGVDGVPAVPKRIVSAPVLALAPSASASAPTPPRTDQVVVAAPFARRSFATGLDRLLEQARREDA